MSGEDEKKAAADGGGAQSARLRDDIDRGSTGDKVAFSDPAAAPLGTDAEPGGSPTELGAMAEARKAEGESKEPRQPKKSPAELQRTSHPRPLVTVAVLAVVIAGLALIWVGM